jgi:D-3-phosphoglycerate dehydrogenase
MPPDMLANKTQVAYLMADISDVRPGQIKEISDSLEALSCKFGAPSGVFKILT